MPAPGAGGVQTSLVGTVQSMMASARATFRRKPGPTPGAPIQSPGGNPPDLTQFCQNRGGGGGAAQVRARAWVNGIPGAASGLGVEAGGGLSWYPRLAPVSSFISGG
jgi:hypothetical protein